MGIRAGDGSRTWISINSRPLTAPGAARPHAVVTTFHDITARRQAEADARESGARLQLAVEASSTGLWDWNLATDQVYFSAEWKRQIGYGETELPNVFATWADRLHPNDREKTLTKALAYKTNGPPWPPYEVEFRLRHKDGAYCWILARGSVVPNDDGTTYRLLGSHLDITERKRAQEALETSQEELRRLSANLMDVREAERTRIAREIHDELGQALTGLKMDVAWIVKRLPEGTSGIRAKASSMSALIDDTVATVRRIATELRPGLLDDLGLAAAIEWQAQEFERRTGIRCELRADLNDASLDTETSTALFRIFQEGLTNVARHASATSVVAVLSQDDGGLVLEVRDDGSGISERDASSLRSIGLAGMRERAQLVGGVFSIMGGPGEGTTVRITIPRAPERGDA
jgi:two-component system sensor histidine kinase UhpB